MTTIHVKQHVADLLERAYIILRSHDEPLAADVQAVLGQVQEQITADMIQQGQEALSRQWKEGPR